MYADNPTDLTEDSWDGVGQVPPPLPPHTDRDASQQGMEAEDQVCGPLSNLCLYQDHSVKHTECLLNSHTDVLVIM